MMANVTSDTINDYSKMSAVLILSMLSLAMWSVIDYNSSDCGRCDSVAVVVSNKG
jgi:hypothetical protein